jgi:citrate lyase subunit beta/citryl-CoA lyase
MVETASGLVAAYDMARASQRVRALSLGDEDPARDLGAIRTQDCQELAHARAHLVLAARTAGAVAIDSIYADPTNLDGLLADGRTARHLGYSGKLLVHPAQMEPIHNAFAPSREEVARARRVVKDFEAAQARGEALSPLRDR